MQNQIILDSSDCGTFIGPLAQPYVYTRELRERLTELFESAKRSTNRHFVLEGTITRAAQSTLTGARHYMADNRVLVSVQGCGQPTHVTGTNDGIMPCGAILSAFGETRRYYCALCDWQE
jgi:hypothetical protein